MKKKNVINLIRYYAENNDAGFRAEAFDIAREFDAMGDNQLSDYIIALLSNANTFVPQSTEGKSDFFEKLSTDSDPLPVPECIEQDLLGIIHAIDRNIGVNKYLFQGPPGTGKTESVKQVSRILNRELYSVNFTRLIDSKLGQTQKNIVSLFSEINSLSNPDRVVILFDEIDAIALDRTNQNDLREMGRTTSSLLKELDRVNDKVVIIATTNLFDQFDKAILRRFDAIIDFNRYSREDLLDISEIILSQYLSISDSFGKNIKLFRKIVSAAPSLPSPGELKNIIKAAVAFSDPSNSFDYMKRLYQSLVDQKLDVKELAAQGFTVREIETLTGISKSTISRSLKEA